MADTFTTRFPDASQSAAIGSIPINYASGNQTFEAYGRVRALYITTAGTLKLTFANGTVDTIPVEKGVLPVEIIQIWQTGSSTAAGHVWF